MTTEAPVGTDHRRRFPFAIAVVLVGAWLVVLSVLAVLMANPVTINREQILGSDAIIVGVRVAEAKDRDAIRVEKVLAGRGVPPELQLPHFDENAVDHAVRFLIPLRRTRDSFEITPAPAELDGRRLVYPASSETLDAVAKILTTGDERPYP